MSSHPSTVRRLVRPGVSSALRGREGGEGVSTSGAPPLSRAHGLRGDAHRGGILSVLEYGPAAVLQEVLVAVRARREERGRKGAQHGLGGGGA